MYLRRLAQLWEGGVEGGSVARVHDITQRQRGGSDANRRPIDSGNEDLWKANECLDELGQGGREGGCKSVWLLIKRRGGGRWTAARTASSRTAASSASLAGPSGGMAEKEARSLPLL